MENRPHYILAIDPDIEASGLALLNTHTRRFEHLAAMRFGDCVKYLDWLASIHGRECLVVLEDSAFTTHNWHGIGRKTPAVAAAMGRSVGLCHGVARSIADVCRVYGLELRLQAPLKKCWKGKDGKITHEEIAQFVTDMPGRSNQEERDAALMAWVYAGLPIRMRP